MLAAMARLAGAHPVIDEGRADLGAAKSAEEKEENREAVDGAGAERVATKEGAVVARGKQTGPWWAPAERQKSGSCERSLPCL